MTATTLFTGAPHHPAPNGSDALQGAKVRWTDGRSSGWRAITLGGSRKL